MAVIDARMIVGLGFPREDGAKLANALMAREDFSWEEDTIDLTKCKAGLLISGFFYSFLQTIHETQPELLEKARRVSWRLAYPLQEENVQNWMRDFQPVTV